MYIRSLALMLVGVVAVAFGMLAPAPGARASHVPPPGEGNGQQFVWPVPAWVSSTDFYPPAPITSAVRT